MKPISTALKSVFSLITILIISCTAFSQTNQTGNNQGGNNQGENGSGMSFTTTPTLLSGTDLAIGAKYRFTNVYPNTSAIVTIVSATGGATVGILDDNNLTKPEAFSPMINIPANSNGLVEFKIEFFQGTTNTPKNIDTLRLTPMDIDGNALLHEVDALDMGPGSTLSYLTSTLEIAITQTGNEYKAVNIGGNEYPAVDTSARQVMFTLMNTNINHFTYKVGANNLNTEPVGRQKGNYFKGFNYLTPTTILSTKYYSFTATNLDKAVSLNWVTETETNHKNFEVERSFDGKNFTNIGIVSNAVLNNTRKNYQLIDNDNSLLSQGIAYYRLKQVDVDGKFSYSNILVVLLKNNDIKMQTSPNPFVESITTRFNTTENGNAQICLMNVKGQKVLNKSITIKKGFNTVQIDGLSTMPSGVYIATLLVNGKMIASTQIVK
jgi:Secretion system C-terminal sorting domain